MQVESGERVVLDPSSEDWATIVFLVGFSKHFFTFQSLKYRW
jgi:hypothetical protein